MTTDLHITVSCRRGFDTLHELAQHLRGVDFPIELALPWRYEMWQAAAPRFEEMAASLVAANLNVPSVHATQGKITEGSFLSWGSMTAELAQRLGAKVITVHPDRAKRNKASCQDQAKEYLAGLQGETDAMISVETFGDKSRVFTPAEIMDAGLPMTLDVAHLHRDEEVMAIINRYWRSIPVVHLSARNSSEHHLPVDGFCLKVVQTLAKFGWTGIIVLEYLPWHAYRLRSDRRLVERALVENVRAADLPPPCDAYRERPEMWHHSAPWPAQGLR